MKTQLTVLRARSSRPRRRGRGAALLTAMVIVVLVATLAASMMWQQWRSVQVESAERARQQSYWILQGALDWARLILREDARTSANIDHLGEPWATPLAEARLSSFLAIDSNHTDDAPEAFLSGAITDAQSRYNLRNLVDQGKVSPKEYAVFVKLCASAGVPETTAQLMAEQLARAVAAASTQTATTGSSPAALRLLGGVATEGMAGSTGAAGVSSPGFAQSSASTHGGDGSAPLMPQNFDQLRWLGVDQSVLERLRPYVTLLPADTSVNINTAPKEVLAAVIDGMDLGSAQRLVQIRQTTPLKSVNEASTLLARGPLSGSAIGVASSYFEVSGRLRMDDRIVEQRYLVMRNGLDMVTLSRQRGAGLDPAAAPTPQHRD